MAKKKGGKAKVDAVIKEVLEKQIGEQVWEILKEHIQTDVYDEYLPAGRWVWGTKQDSAFLGYQRRYKKGLLNEADKSITINHSPGGSVWELRVTTTAQPTPSVLGDGWTSRPGGFLALLEEGNLGFWSRTLIDIPHPFPRPVITNAQEEVDKNKAKYYAEIKSVISKLI